MKGLLIKDFKMLMLQKMFLVITAGVMLVLFFTNGGVHIGYVISYETVMAAVLIITSLSYDEMDNGMAFLVTLPTGRGAYVRAKYLFGLITMLGVWGISLLLGCLIQRFRWGNSDVMELVLTSAVVLVLGSLIMAIMVPVALIFGTAKCRVVILAVVAVVYAVAFLGAKLVSVQAVRLEELLNAFFEQNTAMLLGECFLAGMVILLISYAISARHMRHKQF